MKRKQFSKEFKAKAAVEAIKGQSTANELAQEYEVHVSQINLWKMQFLDAAPTVFGRGKEREKAAVEEERDRLYPKMQLTAHKA